MDRISLFEEYRLIERSELEISGAWRGAHLLLFFMAFVFGSFCTFCFHMLMYLFDEKCVLFPKLLSLTSLSHNVIYEFIPADKETADRLPVDFVGTQWMEKSACYLPTYVPLMSGIFGLVWTTMFLMCSTGSTTLTGLQRPWRVLLPVFIFSVAMGGLCIYSSSVTHYGLNELCIKLGEITGSATCTYTVNVATLAYERRIRGVYQAIRLTVLSAWLHTVCWLLSALLTLVRVFLAIDFQLVRINVSLVGNIDKMLEHHETQIRTVSPEVWYSDEMSSQSSLPLRTDTKTHHRLKTLSGTQTDEKVEVLYKGKKGNLYISKYTESKSEQALVPSENEKLDRLAAYKKVPKDMQFIVDMLFDLVKNIKASGTDIETSSSLLTTGSEEELITKSDVLQIITRQKGQLKLSPKDVNFDKAVGPSSADSKKAKETEKHIKRMLQDKLNRSLNELYRHTYTPAPPPSSMNITKEMKNIIKAKKASTSTDRRERDTQLLKEDADSTVAKKSNLKNAFVQTEKSKKQAPSTRVQISEPPDTDESTGTVRDAEKETQTTKKKDKQD